VIFFRAALCFCIGTLLVGCASLQVERAIVPALPGPNQHRLVSIPAGTYLVGAVQYAVNPRRKLNLRSFRIADAETTNEQFARFAEATGYITDAERRGYGLVSSEGMLDWAWNEMKGASWRAPFGPDGLKAYALPNHPVTQISGADAEAYCKWIGGRLPTLDEWEVAARSGSITHWPWGDKFDSSRANVWNGTDHRHNTREDGWVYTAPVRSYAPNAWGLYDVVGNVFEYCADLPSHYRPKDAQRLICGRGGSWWCSASTCNYFNLDEIGTMDRHGSLANQGFRIVLDN